MPSAVCLTSPLVALRWHKLPLYDLKLANSFTQWNTVPSSSSISSGLRDTICHSWAFHTIYVTEPVVNQEPDRRHLPDVTALLASAEQRRIQAGPTTDLMACLLDEVWAGLSADHVYLWEVVAQSTPRLVFWRGDSQGVPQNAMHAACGVVKRVPQSGTRRDQQSTDGYVASCLICDGIQLVLEAAIPDWSFDQQQLLDLSEVFADLYRRKLMSRLAITSKQEKELAQIVALLHQDLDPLRIANCVASDTVELLSSHRISVARRRFGDTWELIAATAVSQPDPRADASQAICVLIGEASRHSRQREVDESERLATPTLPGVTYSVHPLTVSGRWESAEWAAVFEWMDARPSDVVENYVVQICRHAATAFRNCDAATRNRGRSSLRRFRSAVQTRRVLFGGLLTLAVIVCLMFWKLELRIEVSGRLVPSERSFVFAPEDGVITEVLVEDGSAVSRGNLLCRLRNEDLEIQLEGVDGEVAATTARLAALESLRGDRSLNQAGLLSAEYAELKVRLISFEAQAVILKRRMQHLNLEAGMDGRIYGDRLQEMLRGRPVQRGQYLFELANPKHGWQLDFRVPESDARHLADAQALSQNPLRVSYSLETEPERVMQTSISRISASTDVDEYGRLSTLATAIPNAVEIKDPRTGAGVVGQIHCGRQSAGYVLFRRIIEAFQRGWWM